MIIWPNTPKFILCSMSQAVLSLNDCPSAAAKSMPNISPFPRISD